MILHVSKLQHTIYTELRNSAAAFLKWSPPGQAPWCSGNGEYEVSNCVLDNLLPTFFINASPTAILHWSCV